MNGAGEIGKSVKFSWTDSEDLLKDSSSHAYKRKNKSEKNSVHKKPQIPKELFLKERTLFEGEEPDEISRLEETEPVANALKGGPSENE